MKMSGDDKITAKRAVEGFSFGAVGRLFSTDRNLAKGGQLDHRKMLDRSLSALVHAVRGKENEATE